MRNNIYKLPPFYLNIYSSSFIINNMKILIVSDSHGHNEIIDDLIRDNKDVEIFLHAGDSEVPPHTLYPFRVVKGNSDYTFDMVEQYIIPSPFGNILLRHKENDIKKDFLIKNNIKIVVFGHTHVKTCISKNDICYINPGSLAYPRDEGTSYAILENEEKECFLTFYDAETKKEIKKYHIYLRDPNNKVEPIEEIKENKSNNLIKGLSRKEISDTIKEEIKKLM